METYGSDKPDRRFDLKIQHLNSTFKNTSFKVFQSVVSSGGTIRGFSAPAKASGEALSRTMLDKLIDVVKPFGAQGLIWMKMEGGNSNRQLRNLSVKMN